MAYMSIFNIFLAGMLERRILHQVVLITLALPMTVACSSQSTLSDKAENSADNRPVVLTTFTILADMARQVAGDRLQV